MPVLTNIVCARLFGSRVRGDHDDVSDHDVLVVLEDKLNPDALARIEDEVSLELGVRVDVSFYSETHLRKLFEGGHLFAWHLWRESVPLAGRIPDLIEIIGPPEANTDARQEIQDLLLLLCSIPSKRLNSRTLVYDAGILYVIIRNVGTSATWFFGPSRLDFGRYSPWALNRLGGPPPPIDEEGYHRLLHARKAGMAGLPAPAISLEELRRWYDQTAAWIGAVCRQIDSSLSDGEIEAFLTKL